MPTVQDKVPIVGGAVVYWNIGSNTNRQATLERLAELNLDQFTPEPRTPNAALADALREVYGGATVLVRPLKNREDNGFTVVDEERRETRNEYRQRLVARVKDGRLEVEHPQYGLCGPEEVLLTAFQNALLTISPAAVSKCLVEILQHLGGTRLRENGSVYWLPEYALSLWEKIAAVVEQAAVNCKSTVYLLRTVMDDATIRAVKDAIVYEVCQAAEAIQEEVAGGELGERALQTREQRAKDLHYRVRTYETILGEALDTLHEVVGTARQAAASAMALQEHEEDGAFLAVFG
jgi:hypothetical protein